VQFADGEWLRFVGTWLDKPSDGIVEKTCKIHDDYTFRRLVESSYTSS